MRVSTAGGSCTLTILLRGEYYTVERIRPDFTNVADDAKLELPQPSDESIVNKLRVRLQEISGEWTQEGRCERRIIDALLTNGQIVFGPAFQALLRKSFLGDAEPTNKAYYEVKKAFVGAWHRLNTLIATGV